MSTAFSAGRWMGITEPEHAAMMVGLEYVSALLDTTRPEHSAHHGKIYAIDDPFWQFWYPPNGFHCYCDVISRYNWEPKAGSIKLTNWDGAKIPTMETKAGIVYDFNYNAGQVLASGNVEALAI